MEHTNEWNDIRGWQRRKQEQQQQREAEQRRKEQVVQALPPLPLRAIPLPWEDLPSLLCRTARKMGYERPHWLLQPEHIAYSIDPAALPLLHRRTDHLFLQRFLLLEEVQLYRLTLHAFTDRLRLAQAQKPDVPDLTTLVGYASPQDIGRPLLWQEQHLQLFQTDKHTRVCPSCLDEQEGYDRLYWRCRLLCACPRHAVYLVDCCPQCHKPIPALRSSPTTCPTCRTGDYRSLVVSVSPEESWLLESQAILLHQLGVDGAEMGGYHLTNGSQILGSLPSWDYVPLLEHSLCAFQQVSARRDASLSFLTRSLALEATVTRLAQHLRILPLQLRPLILMRYSKHPFPSTSKLSMHSRSTTSPWCSNHPHRRVIPPGNPLETKRWDSLSLRMKRLLVIVCLVERRDSVRPASRRTSRTNGSSGTFAQYCSVYATRSFSLIVAHPASGSFPRFDQRPHSALLATAETTA